MTFDTDIEKVGDEILNLMKGQEFEAKLLSIAQEKGNDFQFLGFRTRKFGWANMEAELPALYVMGLREELIKDDGDMKWVWFKFAVEVWDSADDSESLERSLNRYARAVDETLSKAYRNDGIITGIDYAPVFKYENSLIKVCSIAIQIRISKSVI